MVVVDPIATEMPTTDACFATLRTYPEEDRKVADGARIVVLGSRGSIPVSGAEFVRYGGNTTSVALTNGNRVVGFVDAGTGLAAHAAFGLELASTVEVFLTHYHWDHIQGLPFFKPFLRPGANVTLYAPVQPGDITVGEGSKVGGGAVVVVSAAVVVVSSAAVVVVSSPPAAVVVVSSLSLLHAATTSANARSNTNRPPRFFNPVMDRTLSLVESAAHLPTGATREV